MILLTGSTGFIGSFMIKYFEKKNIGYKSVSRSKNPKPNNFQINLDESVDLSSILDGVDVIIHAAAKAHVLNEFDYAHSSEYRKINTLATLNLARQSIENNVKKFIFLSTIKVNGESTTADNYFSEMSKPNPVGPYALSKYEAEQGLLEIFRDSNTELIILRIPLVYGPGVKGNLRSLIKAINLSMPLPFKSIKNKRNLLSIYNLADVLILIANHSSSLKQLYLLSDNKAISLPNLILSIGSAISKTPLLLYIPSSFLEFIFRLMGRDAQFKKLTENLQINSSLIRKDLAWQQAYDIKNSFIDCPKSSNS